MLGFEKQQKGLLEDKSEVSMINDQIQDYTVTNNVSYFSNHFCLFSAIRKRTDNSDQISDQMIAHSQSKEYVLSDVKLNENEATLLFSFLPLSRC